MEYPLRVRCVLARVAAHPPGGSRPLTLPRGPKTGSGITE